MVKALYILLLGMALSYSSHAQQYFNIRDALHSTSSLFTSVVERNNKYYCTGFCIDSINHIANDTFANISGVKFAVYDGVGNKLLDTVYQKVWMKSVQAWSSSSLYLLPDGHLLLAVQYQDTNKWNALVVKFDSLGHILSEREYAQPFCNDNDWYKVTDFKPTGSGEWLLLGDVSCYVNAPQIQNVMALTKLDSNLDVIWSKEYGNPPRNHIPTKVLVVADGYVLAGGTDDANIVTGGSYFQPELIKVDTSGLWQWTWVRGLGGYYGRAMDIMRTQDGGYVYCGQGEGQAGPGGIAWHGWVEKLDASRQSIWHHTLSAMPTTTDYNQLDALLELPDSSIVVAGGLTGGYDAIDSANDFIYGALMRFDASGNTIWQRKYTAMPDGMVYYLYDMKKTSDDGYVLVGEATDINNHYGAPIQRGWIIKVDSNGCMSPTACDATAVAEPAAQGNSIKVYPNPASDVLLLSYDNISGGRINIMDMTGRMLVDEELSHRLDIKLLAPGLYVYRITQGRKILAQDKLLKY